MPAQAGIQRFSSLRAKAKQTRQIHLGGHVAVSPRQNELEAIHVELDASLRWHDNSECVNAYFKRGLMPIFFEP